MDTWKKVIFLQKTQCVGMKNRDSPAHGLYTVEIRLTKNCNLTCRHCSVSAGKVAEDELNLEEITGVIDEISEMGVHYLVLTGGEPLLFKKLSKVLDCAVSRSLKVSIDTNGILLSKKKALELKKSGISTIQVSLDGMEKTHDKIRGSRAFEMAVKGIKNSVDAGVYTTINFTASKMNKDDLPEVILLAKELRVDALTLERFVPIGRGGEINEQMLTSQGFKECLKTLLDEKVLRTNSTDPLSIFLKPDVLNKYSTEELNSRICGGCTAGIAALTISYDGSVYLCPKLEVKYGNIRDSSLLEIWTGGEIGPVRFRELGGKCGACRWKNLCGGCRAAAKAVYGDYLGYDPTCFVEEC